MADPVSSLNIIIPVIVGIAIGILEAFFVYEDENMVSGKQFLGDMWHGFLFALLGVLIATNVPFVLSLIQLPATVESILFVDEMGRSIVISVLITIFMLTKMVASPAVKGVRGQGFKEKFWHKLVVAVAVGFSPYYIFLLYDIPFFVELQETFPFPL